MEVIIQSSIKFWLNKLNLLKWKHLEKDLVKAVIVSGDCLGKDFKNNSCDVNNIF